MVIYQSHTNGPRVLTDLDENPGGGPWARNDHGYKSPGLTELVSPTAVKKSYHRALVLIHPDKVKQKGGDTARVFIADKVFDMMKDAYKVLEAKEM